MVPVSNILKQCSSKLDWFYFTRATVCVGSRQDLRLAYELKEYYIAFSESASVENAEDRLKEITCRFADSNIREYDEFYTLLTNWKAEIVNSFIEINDIRINNG